MVTSILRIHLNLAKQIFLIGFTAFSVMAQQDRGTILGIVQDTSEAVIAGASVVVRNKETGKELKLTTDSSGLFVAPELPVGTYQVSVSLQGFKTKVQDGIVLRVSDRTRLMLNLEPGEVRETTTVTGQTPLIETASNTLGVSIGGAQVQNLPLNGRDINVLLAQVPGVNLRGNMFQQSMNGLNTGGQSVSLVTFLMDGVDASRVDAQTITITYGRSQNRIARVNAEGVQEFRMYTNSFSAEFGSSTGAAVNIITKSGGNTFHGSAFEFLRNEKLDARNYFNRCTTPGCTQPTKPAFRLNQFGGSFGGPIVRDKAFFFGSYEGIRQRTGTTLVALVPTQAFRDMLPAELKPVVAMLPLPNASGSADSRVGFRNEGRSGFLREDSVFVRGDYNLSDKDRLNARYNANASLTKTHFGVGEGQIAPSDGLLQNAKITYTRAFGPTLLNEASFAFNRMHIDPRGSIDPTVAAFPVTTVGGMAAIGPALYDLSMVGNSFTALDTLSWVKGRNQFKFGTQIIRNQQNKALFNQMTVSYANLDDFVRNSPSSVGILGYDRTGLRNTYYNFFAEDNIQTTRKLTVMVGLRYQLETSPADSNNRQANFDPLTGLDPVGAQLMNMPKTNIGPRLSFAYSPFDSSKTVVRGAYGIYFVNFNATLVQNTPINGGKPTNFSFNQDPMAPLLAGFPFPDISSLSGTRTLSAVQRSWNTPYVQNWNLNIQYEIATDLRLQVGYVGNKGIHIITPAMELNRFLPGTNIRPYPGFGSISYLRTNGISNYNALQVVLTRRLARGLLFNVNYTWGHALDDSPPIFSGNSDDKNVRLDYGTTESDVKHLLSFDYVYEVPALRKLPRWLGEGWQINGLTEIRSGLPINVMCGCDPLRVSQFNSRADYVPGVSSRPGTHNIPGSQLNIRAFQSPPNGRIGDVARGAFRGTAVFNFDFSVFKKFQIERHQFQFRAEVFNIFNTPQFNLPGASIASPGNFGVSTSTLSTVSNFGTQRQIQFGLRYNF
jgi:Carboxypeptidase regulatory-like domain/TonB dependent receptor